MPAPPRRLMGSTEMSDLQATIGGGVAGALAPLATSAVNAFNGQGQVTFSNIPWALMLVFALIGAAVVYFVAERVRRHVFTYGVVAPFLVLGVLNSYKAEQTRNAEQLAKDAKENADIATRTALDLEANQKKTAAAAAEKPKPNLGSEAVEALIESDQPAL